MTRVLVIEAAGNLWGSERALLDLLGAVAELDVAVCCPPGRPLLSELQRRRIRVLPYYVYASHERSKWARLRAVGGVLRACLAFRADVLYLNQSGSYRVALVAATLLRLPIVAHVRIFEDVTYLSRHRPHPGRLRGLIAISAAIEEELRRYPSLAAIRVHRRYDAYVTSSGSSPVPVGHQSDDRIACVGRMVPIKGQDLLVAALGLLQRSGHLVSCVMVGEGEDAFVRALQDHARELAVDACITWRGFVDDVVSLLRTCSMLVCSSRREPLGRVIFEAWDAGVVPIAFAGSGGAAEIIRAAGGGILYDDPTPASLATAIRQGMALTSEERACLVSHGRSWMAKHCAPGPYGEAIASILNGARA